MNERATKPSPLRVLVIEGSPFDSGRVVLELERAGFAPEAHRVTIGELKEALLKGWDVVVADVERERLRALIDKAHVGLAQLDVEGRFTLVNERFSEIVGRKAELLVGAAEGEITHPDDRHLVARIRDGARDARGAHAIEKRYVRPNGDHVWVSGKVSVLFGVDDRAMGMVIVADDITSRRGVDHEREELLRELERTVKVSEMSAGVLGHDLRNPLMTITMGAALLLRHCTERGSDEMTEIVTRIARSSERMRRMIDQLLDFTRIRIGKGVPIVAQRVDLAELTRQVIDEIGEADAAHVRLECDGSTIGEWDRDRLLQLLSNLVANAVDHRKPNTEVIVRLDGSSEVVVELSIANQGCIPAALLESIFDPLHTTKDSRRDRASGLGLGLFITRQIARAHGGSISVVSDDENGTRFVVSLPRSAPDGGSQRQPSSFELSVPSSKETGGPRVRARAVKAR